MRRAFRTKWVWVVAGIVLGAALAELAARHHLQRNIADGPPSVTSNCEAGIGAARAHAGTAAGVDAAGWTPKINDSRPPGTAPRGMVWIPGGQFWMGAQDDHMPDTKPWHRVYVDGFWMDQTVVTNEQFARFVESTGYVTIAERKPRAEDFPHAPPENLVAGSVVFSPPDHPVGLANHFLW